MTNQCDDVAKVAAGLDPIQVRLLNRLGRHWIKGGGFAPYCVVTELIEAGLADQMNGLRRETRRIRLSAKGIAVRDHLQQKGSSHD